MRWLDDKGNPTEAYKDWEQRYHKAAGEVRVVGVTVLVMGALLVITKLFFREGSYAADSTEWWGELIGLVGLALYIGAGRVAGWLVRDK